MEVATLNRCLHRDCRAPLHIEEGWHLIELFDVLDHLSKGALAALLARDGSTLLDLSVVEGLELTKGAVSAIAVLVPTHALCTLLAVFYVRFGKPFHRGLGVVWVALRVAVAIDIEPFVAYISLTLLALDSVGVEQVPFVTRSSLLAAYLSNGPAVGLVT